MVDPLKLYEQLKRTTFVQTRTIALYFGISVYDKVVGYNKKTDEWDI